MAKFKTQTTGQREKVHAGQTAAYRAVKEIATADPNGHTDVWEWNANGNRWDLFERIPHASVQTSWLSGPTGMDRRILSAIETAADELNAEKTSAPEVGA